MVPHAVLAAGWIPFTVVLVLVLIFSFIYIRFYQSKYDSEVCSTLTSIAGLAIALVTSSLLPVDIFLVSYMKDTDGKFKDWASSAEARKSIEDTVLYAYCAMYLCVMLFVFFILPFGYFFYEEGDEDTTCKSRCCTAMKYSVIFIIMAGVLTLLGFVIPFRGLPNNETESQKLEFIFKNMGQSKGQDALSLIVSVLTLGGMFCLIMYTGFGLSSWPMDLVKGKRSARKEMVEVQTSKEEMKEEIQAIRNKYTGSRRMSARDRRRLETLEERERVMDRRERHLDSVNRSCLTKCAIALRPFEVVFGSIFFLLTLLIFASLLVSCIDKIINGLGPRMGYALPRPHFPNPIDITLRYAQLAFPLDYVLMIGIIMYLFFCSMGGIRHIGVWCCWIKMYDIRPRRTKPQGLLYMCFILMFVVMAINIIIYELTPQYATFGSQLYVASVNGTLDGHPSMCTTDAPDGQCVMTRMSYLLTRFFYKVWIFGAIYYWATWAFLGVIVLAFLVTLIKKRRSSIEGVVSEDDFEDSDEDLMRA